MRLWWIAMGITITLAYIGAVYLMPFK